VVPALLDASDRGEAGGKAQRETYGGEKEKCAIDINLAPSNERKPCVYCEKEEATRDILMLNYGTKDVIKL